MITDFGIAIKSAFPIFSKYPDLVYLDNAATTQKPKVVVEKLAQFYNEENSNIHRGVYDLSANATDQFENARTLIGDFIGTTPNNIAFSKGTTESINIVANSFKSLLTINDNVVTTIMEHHANFIPWQMLCKATGAELRICKLHSDLSIDLEHLETLIDEKTKVIAVTHISNTTGIINPVNKIVQMAKRRHIPVLIDAAQSASLHGLHVDELDCDFIAFSAHKAFGPFGVGALYVSDEYRDKIHPLSYGGGAIRQVSMDTTHFLQFPHVLEAGTQSIGEVIATGETIKFICTLDRAACLLYILKLEEYCRSELNKINGVQALGEKSTGSGIVSFYHDQIHPHDIASFLNQDNIAVRAGHHCTQPLLNYLDIPATVRVSFSIYNTTADVEKLSNALKNSIDILL